MRRPVHRGRHDHKITSPTIITTHIGTVHSNMLTNVLAIEGRLRNSTASKNDYSILSEISDEMRPDLHGASTRERERAWEEFIFLVIR
jgi:hypothetical protein